MFPGGAPEAPSETCRATTECKARANRSSFRVAGASSGMEVTRRPESGFGSRVRRGRHCPARRRGYKIREYSSRDETVGLQAVGTNLGFQSADFRMESRLSRSPRLAGRSW